jgi:O-antigen/teichoic acid export membrane protein
MFNLSKIVSRPKAPLRFAQVSETKRLTAIGVLSNLLGLVGHKIIALLLAIMLTRSMTIADFGIFNLFLSIIALFGGVALGLDKVIQRYFPMLVQVDPTRAIGLFIVFMLKRYLVFAVLVTIGYVASRAGILPLEQIDREYVVIALSAAAMLAGRLGSMIALNSAYLDHRYLNAAALTGDLLKLAGIFFLGNGRILNVLLIWTLAEGVVLVLMATRLAHKIRCPRLPLLLSITFRELDYKRYYHYAKYFAVASLGTYVLTTEFDYLFLSYFCNRSDIGLYAFAAKLPFILLMLAPSNLMFNITLPILIDRIDAGRDIQEANHNIITFVKLNIFVWTILASAVAFNIESIIGYVFDPKYLASKNYIYGWFVILYAIVIKNVFEPVARALEYAKVYRLTFMAAMCNLLANFIFVPLFGLAGAIHGHWHRDLIAGLSFLLGDHSKNEFASELPRRLAFNH